MCGMISSSFLLFLGSVLTFAEDAGADSPPMHDSGLIAPPLQQGDVVNPPPNELAHDAYMLSDDQGVERLVSGYVSNADSSQSYTHILDDLTLIVTQLAQQELKRLERNRFYAPIFVGKTSAPLITGTKSSPYFVGEKSSPYDVGKRAVPYFVGQESAPYLVYEKAASYFGGKEGTSYFVGKSAVGRKSVPMFVWKKSAPLFVGKKAAPMFVGKRRLTDILDNLSGSNMQKLYENPVARIPSKEGSHLAIPVKWSSDYPQNADNEFLKRMMYHVPFIVDKWYNSPLFTGKSQQETLKIRTSKLAFFRALKITFPML